MSFEGLLIHEVYLQTRYSSQNEIGEWNFLYSSASTTTTCRISPLTASERIDKTGLYDNVKYKCFVPSSVALNRDMRVVFRGDSYRVKETILDSESFHKTGLLIQIT